MIWVAYVLSGIFAAVCAAVILRGFIRKHKQPDWNILDEILKKIINGR